MIKKAQESDCAALAGMAHKMWTDAEESELRADFESLACDDNAALFIKYADGSPAAFAQCQLRHDYVEGCVTSPVAYLEGIFVLEPYRKRGFAKELLSECEKWAKQKGCKEFASDCELSNIQSQNFHRAAGFAEANRIVCFKKVLEK